MVARVVMVLASLLLFWTDDGQGLQLPQQSKIWVAQAQARQISNRINSLAAQCQGPLTRLGLARILWTLVLHTSHCSSTYCCRLTCLTIISQEITSTNPLFLASQCRFGSHTGISRQKPELALVPVSFYGVLPVRT